jgi:hypothetical protein
MELVIGCAILWAAWQGTKEAAHSVTESYRDRRNRWQTRAARRRGWTTRDLMAPTVSARAVKFGITTGAVLGTASVAAWLAGKGFGRGARAGWSLGRTWGQARLQRRRYGVEPGEPDEATEVVDAELVDEDQADEQPPTPREPVTELADRPADPPKDVPANRPGDSPNGETEMAEQIQSDVVTYDTHVHNLTVLQGEARAEFEAAELAWEAAGSAKNRATADAQHVEQITAGLAAVDFGPKHVANMAQIQELIAAQVQAATALQLAAAALMEQAEVIEASAERARQEFEADHRALAEAHADAPHAAKREGYEPQ